VSPLGGALPIETTIGGKSTGQCAGCTPSWASIAATLKVDVHDPPMHVKSDESFLVTADVSIINLTYNRHLGRRRVGLKLVPDPHPSVPQFMSVSSMQEIVHHRFQEGEVRFVLSLAGAKVEPSGSNSVSSDGRVEWSVKSDSAGVLTGFIRPDFLKSKGEFSGDQKVEYTSDDYIPIRIEVNERIMTPTRMLSAVSGFFGSLLTLPGILAFIEHRRKKRKKSKQTEKGAGARK
jgi:hypothetical protein